MVETIVIILAVIAFAGGLGLAAALKGRERNLAAERRARRPAPLAMPATQTADVEAKTGADPAARL